MRLIQLLVMRARLKLAILMIKASRLLAKLFTVLMRENRR